MRIKITLALALCIMVFKTSFCNTENDFLSRSYWKTNPSISSIKLKIQDGHDVTELDEHAFDAVSMALIENVDNETIKFLLSFEGNNVNKITHDGRTYIFWAAYRSNLELMKYLVENGAKTDLVDSHGYSLHNFTAVTGQTDKSIYDFCFSHGSSVSEVNNEGANCLLLVIPFVTDFSLIDYFLEHGASYSDEDMHGNGLFNYGSKRGNTDLLNHLADKGVKTNTTDSEGENAFFKAAYATRGYTNTVDVFKHISSLGTDVNAVNIDGKNVLHITAGSNSNADVTRFLLTSGVNASLRDKNGNTPFHMACSRNELEIIKLLHEHSASLFENNQEGYTPFDLAVANNSLEVLEFLKTNYKTEIEDKSFSPEIAHLLVSSFNESSEDEFFEKLNFLKKLKIDFTAKNEKEQSILHLAVLKKNKDLVSQILVLKTEVNALDNEGQTALHLASMKSEDLDIIKLLIENGADKNITTEFGERAFDLASENERLLNSKELETLLK